MKRYGFVINNTLVKLKNSDSVPEPLPLEGTWVELTDNDSTLLMSTYDETYKRFIPPKPYPSWVYDSNINNWVAPIPAVGIANYWDESNKVWKTF